MDKEKAGTNKNCASSFLHILCTFTSTKHQWEIDARVKSRQRRIRLREAQHHWA